MCGILLHSSVVFLMTLGVAISQSASISTTTTSSIRYHSSQRRKVQRVSQDQDGSRKSQIRLDPLLICLFPTFSTLEEEAFQNDMRRAMRMIVSQKLADELEPNRLEYFEFTDAKQIAWYSGDEEDLVCGNSDAVLPVSTSASRFGGISTLNGSEGSAPCTCALYPRLVVVVVPFDESELPSSETIEAMIARILEEGLVQALQDISSDNVEDPHSKTTSPLYVELESASAAWGVAMQEEGRGSSIVPTKEDEVATDAPTTTSLAGHTSGPVPVTKSPSTTPYAIPNDNIESILEGGNSFQVSTQSNMERYGSVVLIAVSVLFVLTCCCCLCYIRIRRCRRSRLCCFNCCSSQNYADGEEQRQEDDPHDSNASNFQKPSDTATVVGEDSDEEEHTHDSTMNNYRTLYEQHFGGGQNTEDDGATIHTGDASEMAQYQQGELLECISVASEWTLGTKESNSSLDRSSTNGGNSTRLMVAAELMAAKEAFDRDRHITIQKDMLHSEWSSTPAFNGVVEMNPLDESSHNELSFEQAYDSTPGQGEEVYLMPPRSSRKPSMR